MLLSTGERISCALVAMAIHDLGEERRLVHRLAGRDPHRRDAHAGPRSARSAATASGAALDEGEDRARRRLPGVLARHDGDHDARPRRRTDATAVALAAALGGACEIYSDVPGVFTADPRLVPEARKLPVVSYDEMLEMAASGAKVLMLRSVELARTTVCGFTRARRSPTRREPGCRSTGMEQAIISAVTHSETDVVFTLTGIPDRPGVAALIFDGVASAQVNVDTIIQNVVHGRAEMSFSVPAEDADATRGAIATLQDELGAFDVRGQPRARQGLADRRRHALPPRRRGDDVPHARRARDQPRDDLDLADQDLLHDRPRPDPGSRARPSRRVPARARARGEPTI